MAWFRNDLYHRVLTTSGTFVNQAWPFDEKYPDAAWGFHETLIPERTEEAASDIFISGRRQRFAQPQRDAGQHARLGGSQIHRMAKVLKEKGYEYQYLFCQGSWATATARPSAVSPTRHRMGVEGVYTEEGQVVAMTSSDGRCSPLVSVEGGLPRTTRWTKVPALISTSSRTTSRIAPGDSRSSTTAVWLESPSRRCRVNQYFQQAQKAGGHSFFHGFDRPGVTGFGWMAPGQLVNPALYGTDRADCPVVPKPPEGKLANRERPQ